MCNFPTDIEYTSTFEDLTEQNIDTRTFSYLKKPENGIVGSDFLNGITSMRELEALINKKINAYTCDCNDNVLKDIFCYIQIWGGFRGITLFTNNIPFQEKWEKEIKEQYRLLVKTCIDIKASEIDSLNISDCDIDIIYKAICTARENVKGFDVAFITKHTRFWLQKNNFNNPLPIFDKWMARGLYGASANIILLKPYWKCMIQKAKSLNNGMSLLSLERQLFNYFRTTREDSEWDAYETFERNDGYTGGMDLIHPGYCLPLKNKAGEKEHYRIFVARQSSTELYFCKLEKEWGNVRGNIDENPDAYSIFYEFTPNHELYNRIKVKVNQKWYNSKNGKDNAYMYRYIVFNDTVSMNEAISFMKDVKEYVQNTLRN